jgi:hypothetical protein
LIELSMTRGMKPASETTVLKRMGGGACMALLVFTRICTRGNERSKAKGSVFKQAPINPT